MTGAVAASAFDIDGNSYSVNADGATVTLTSGSSDTREVTIPASVSDNGTTYTVTAIGEAAFAGRSGLMSVDIPNTVTTIGDGAFAFSTDLTWVDIPNSVTTIAETAFSACIGLKTVTIPASVTKIGKWAFYGCSSLISIYCHIADPAVLPSPDEVTVSKSNAHGYSFEGIPACVLYVPKGSAEKYRKHKQFEKFSEIVEIQTP